jgi:hypothetical protein
MMKIAGSGLRIHASPAWIRGSGSGSTPKCHGSAKLVSIVNDIGNAHCAGADAETDEELVPEVGPLAHVLLARNTLIHHFSKRPVGGLNIFCVICTLYLCTNS